MNIFIYYGECIFHEKNLADKIVTLVNGLSERRHRVTIAFSNEINDDVCDRLNSVVQKTLCTRREGRIAFYKRIVESKPEIFIAFCNTPDLINIFSLLYKYDVPIALYGNFDSECSITEYWASHRKVTRYQAIWERQLLRSQSSFSIYEKDMSHLLDFISENCANLPKRLCSKEIYIHSEKAIAEFYKMNVRNFHEEVKVKTEYLSSLLELCRVDIAQKAKMLVENERLYAW